MQAAVAMDGVKDAVVQMECAIEAARRRAAARARHRAEAVVRLRPVGLTTKPRGQSPRPRPGGGDWADVLDKYAAGDPENGVFFFRRAMGFEEEDEDVVVEEERGWGGVPGNELHLL